LILWNQTTALTRGRRPGISVSRLWVIHEALSPPSSVDAVSAIISGFPVSAVISSYEEPKICAMLIHGTSSTGP
jgi:hypothetical protein